MLTEIIPETVTKMKAMVILLRTRAVLIQILGTGSAPLTNVVLISSRFWYYTEVAKTWLPSTFISVQHRDILYHIIHIIDTQLYNSVHF